MTPERRKENGVGREERRRSVHRRQLLEMAVGARLQDVFSFLSVSHFTVSLFTGFPFYRFPIYRFRYYRNSQGAKVLWSESSCYLATSPPPMVCLLLVLLNSSGDAGDIFSGPWYSIYGGTHLHPFTGHC